MKLVIFGLAVSSSWGNGHATLWRALIRALVRRGWDVTFYERDTPYYASTRDLTALPGARLVLYSTWAEVRDEAAREVAAADVAMVTSYCPDGIDAAQLVCDRRGGLGVFYDLDTPVTLERAARDEPVPYIPPEGLGAFDLVLSYAGGPALEALESRFGARRTAALYGHFDPAVHHPAPANPAFSGDLGYLGTYAADRQPGVNRLLVAPALRAHDRTFVIAGALYPRDFPWADNIRFVRHLPPADHAAFHASTRLSLNVTRPAMVECGWCPSGRLFEAAACGATIVTDRWPGLEAFFTPGTEILPVDNADDVLGVLGMDDAELRRIGEAARERALGEHTADHRAAEFESILAAAGRPSQTLEPA